MPKRNRCSNRGATVGSSGRVPDDPSEFRDGRLVEAVGCNRLRCPICKVQVRSRVDVACKKDCSGQAAEIYETDDWRDLPYIKKSRTGRLYVCRCTVFIELRTTLIDDPDYDPTEGDVKLPWRCAGHPLASLPLHVDGVIIEEEGDLGELVAAAARGQVPKAADGSQRATPVQWLYRLRARLRGLPAADRFEQAVAASLRSGDEDLIAQALLYFSVVSESTAWGEAFAALDGLENRPYRDHKGKERLAFSMLLDRAAQVGRKPDALDQEVIDRVLSAALDPTTPLKVQHMQLLAQLDPEWAADHAPALARGRDRIASALLSALYVVDQHAMIIVAGTRMAHDGDEALRSEVRDWANSDWHSVRAYSVVLRQILDPPAAAEGVEA